MKTAFFFLAASAAVGASLQTPKVWAEGSATQDSGQIQFVIGAAGAFGGNRGINRIVRTRGEVAVAPANRVVGFVGVRGNANLSFTMPADEDGNYTPAYNPFNNKPTMYLGGTAAVVGGGANELDSGVQFEPGTFQDVNGFLAPVGWSAFHYVGEVRVTPRTYNADHPDEAVAWRGGTVEGGQASITGNMRLQAAPDGRVSLSFSPMSTTYGTITSDTIWAVEGTRADPTIPNFIPDATHPLAPWSDSVSPASVVLRADLLRYSSMKRSTALTRSGTSGSNLDGTEMTGTWSDCALLPDPPATDTSDGWKPWTWNFVNQNRTGYDAPRTGDLAYDRRYNGQQTPFSRTIVQFSTNPVTNAQMRSLYIGAERPQNYDRYTTESVVINVKMITRPVGSAVE